MKKIVSLALVVMMIAAMAVTAFAAVDSISFDADKNGIKLGEGVLAPNTTYKFPVLIAKDGAVNSDFTAEDMEGHRFDISVSKGSGALSTPKIVEEDGKYYLTFTTYRNFSSKATDVSVKVRYLSRNPLQEVASVVVDFSVGFAQLPGSAVENLGKGDALQVPPSTPIVTAKQLEALAKLNDYKAVTLQYGDWSMNVKVNNLGDLNLYSTQAPIMEIVKKYEDNKFKFLSFPANPNFGSKGTLTINVSDIEQEFGGEFVLYKYQDGRLYYLTSNYDENAGTLSFSPSQLGTYVITDKKVSDVIIGGSGSGSTGSGSSSSGSSSSQGGSQSSSGSSSSQSNPGTGASGAVGAANATAVALVLTAAFAGVAVTLKKD